MAFSNNICSRHKLWHFDPPQKHLTSYLTGGLKKLYIRLKDECLGDPVYNIGHFTDDKGHFVLKHSCIMASRYRVNSVINTSGQSAVLLKAEDMFKDDEIVVIKVLHRSFSSLGVQETHCLQQLRSADPDMISHTLQLLNVFSFDSHYCMVFEALYPEPITHIFRDIPREKVLPSIKKVAVRLLAILGFLQEENVIHADLKPENILVKRRNDLSSLRMIDFGNAIHHIHREVSLYYDDFQVQTPLYRAPEVIFGIPFGSEIDMWSVGCILAELYLGKPLFFGSDDFSILKKMTSIIGSLPVYIFQRGKFYNKLKDYTTGPADTNLTVGLMEHLKCRDYKFCSFLTGCLQYNPDKRFRPSEAALHPFLASEMPVRFLLESAKDRIYPAVYAPQYSFKPLVESDIQRSQPSSLDLLKLGTSVNYVSQNVACPVAKVGPIRKGLGSTEKYETKTGLKSEGTDLQLIQENQSPLSIKSNKFRHNQVVRQKPQIGLRRVSDEFVMAGSNVHLNDQADSHYPHKSGKLMTIKTADSSNGDKNKLHDKQEDKFSDTSLDTKLKKRQSFPKMGRKRPIEFLSDDEKDKYENLDNGLKLSSSGAMQKSGFLKLGANETSNKRVGKVKNKDHTDRMINKRRKYIKTLPSNHLKTENGTIVNHNIHKNRREAAYGIGDIFSDRDDNSDKWIRHEEKVSDNYIDGHGALVLNSHCNTENSDSEDSHSNVTYIIGNNDGDNICPLTDRQSESRKRSMLQNQYARKRNKEPKKDSRNRLKKTLLGQTGSHVQSTKTTNSTKVRKKQIQDGDKEFQSYKLPEEHIQLEHNRISAGEDNQLHKADTNARKMLKFSDLSKQKVISSMRERKATRKRNVSKRIKLSKSKSSAVQLDCWRNDAMETLHCDALDIGYQRMTERKEEHEQNKQNDIKCDGFSIPTITPDKKLAAINAKRKEKKKMESEHAISESDVVTGIFQKNANSYNQSATPEQCNNSLYRNGSTTPIHKFHRKSATFDLNISPLRTQLNNSLASPCNVSNSASKLNSMIQNNQKSPRESYMEKIRNQSWQSETDSNHHLMVSGGTTPAGSPYNRASTDMRHATGLDVPSPKNPRHDTGLDVLSPRNPRHATGLNVPSPRNQRHATGLDVPSPRNPRHATSMDVPSLRNPRHATGFDVLSPRHLKYGTLGTRHFRSPANDGVELIVTGGGAEMSETSEVEDSDEEVMLLAV